MQGTSAAAGSYQVQKTEDRGDTTVVEARIVSDLLSQTCFPGACSSWDILVDLFVSPCPLDVACNGDPHRVTLTETSDVATLKLLKGVTYELSGIWIRWRWDPACS